MKRLAVFVEGYTELLFVERLLTAVAGANRIQFETGKFTGGKAFPRKFVQLQSPQAQQSPHYYVLIASCCNDENVKDDIINNYKSLVQRGFQSIIGLRDVHPRPSTDIPQLLRYAKFGVKTSPIVVDILFAIREIEAWFLSEVSHFTRIDSSLTVEHIRSTLSLDISTLPVESIHHPSAELGRIYALANLVYEKGHCRTVDALSYEQIYISLPEKVPSLKTLIDKLNLFFTAN